MKTVLRSWVFIALIVFSTEKINAQCTVSNFIIQNEVLATVQTPGTCTITFDMTFNIASNNGNKYIFIHQWIKNQYPDYFQCVNGQPGHNGSIRSPRAANLTNAFLNIGINNRGTIPVLLTTYPPAPSVTLTTVTSMIKIVLPDGSANFTLKGVRVTLPVTCGTPVIIVTDFWSTQASSAKVVHCANCGILYSQFYMSVAGFVNCVNLRYNATLTNKTAIALDGFYKVYADINGDGYFTPTTDTLLSGPFNYHIAAGPSTTSVISGSIPAANRNQDIFLVFTQTTGGASGASRVIILRSTQCGSLPVSFGSFTARRINQSNVALKWETVTEINNNGFLLQRNMGGANSTWQEVAFIRSQAINGNNNSVLRYTYNDLNANKTITQYRVQQLDIDGRSSFSEIRSVRGEGQKGNTIVYPNPSPDGRVNVVFEDRESTRDVTLTDMNGRIIQKWKTTNGNTIQAENLQPGIYIMRIIILKTGEQTIEKIVVSNR